MSHPSGGQENGDLSEIRDLDFRVVERLGLGHSRPDEERTSLRASAYLLIMVAGVFAIAVFFAPVAAAVLLWDTTATIDDVADEGALYLLLPATVLGSFAFGFIFVKLVELVPRLKKAQPAESVGARERAGAVAALNAVGFSYWEQYRHTTDLFFLDQAIALTREAHDEWQGLDDRQPNLELLLCRIRNNFAYYLAEKERVSGLEDHEKALARSFSRYLEERISKYPKHAKQFTDTVQFIRSQLQDT